MSVNKVILLGHVGKDPDVRYLDGGLAVATFSLATTERGYTLQNGTQVPERTDWHNIVLWKGLAEYAEKYIHKGDKVYIEGKLRPRYYDDQNGQRRYIVEVYAEAVEQCTPRAATAAKDSGNTAPATEPKPKPTPNGAEGLPF